MLAAVGNIIGPLRESPPFHRLWWSIFLAGSGRWSTLLVLGWLAFDLTSSEFAVGLMGAAAFAPLALGPLGGVLADRSPRLALLLTGWRLMAAVAGVGAAILVITGTIGIAHIVAASLVIGVTDAGGNPARNALMADLVGRERIARANALSVAGSLGSRMTAPAIAGVVLAFTGSAPALLFAAVWYLASAVVTYGIADSRPVAPPGVEVAVAPAPRRRSGVRTVIWVTAASNVLVWPAVFTFLPVFAEDVFRSGPEGLAWLIGANGFGSILGAGLVAATGDVRRGALFLAAGVGFGISIAALAGTPWLTVAVISSFAAGVAASVFSVMQLAVALLLAPDGTRGRASGWLMAAVAPLPVGALAQGALAARFGVAPVTVACACTFIVLVAVVARRSPPLRNA